jgi:hypothetical protein
MNGDRPIWRDVLTGVISLHSLNEQFYELLNDAVNETHETARETFIKENAHSLQPEELEKFDEEWESQPDDSLLIGFIRDKDNLWDVDPDADFSALVRESVIQVVKSNWVKEGLMCSPCYPNQVDLDSKCEHAFGWMGYCLDPELVNDPKGIILREEYEKGGEDSG